MNLPLFIAHRIYRDNDSGKQVSRPAVLIAMIGIAIGLAVMIVTVSVIVGFKKEVRDKIAGFGSHIQITNLNAGSLYESLPISMTTAELDSLRANTDIHHVQRYSLKAGMIKTDEAFQGMLLKGIGPEYDTEFFRRHLLEGEMPQFSDTASSNRVVISRSLADKLKLKLGDKIDTYFIQDNIRARRLTIAGIYQTNLTEFDNLYLVTDLYTVNRLNRWETDRFSGLELTVNDYSRLEDITWELASGLEGKTDRYGQEFCARNIEQLNPGIFAWLGILDVNIWVILVLMIGVAGFTMISGLLIIIIERTSMIGVLKSLGADNRTIRHLFLWFSVFLIGRGMFWGNVLGLGLCLLQYHTSWVKLDQAGYFLTTVPIYLDWGWWALLNVATFVLLVLLLTLPTLIISLILPEKSIRFE